MCSLISALLVNHLQKFPAIGAVLELRSHANLINWPLVVSQNKEMEKQQNSGNCNNTLTNAYELEGMGSSSFGLKVFKNICLASNMEEAFKSACVDCPHSHQTKCTLKGYVFNCMHTSGGPLSALTCCVNVRLLSAIKKISPLIYSQSWVGSWVYTTQAMMTFTLIF